MTEAELRDACLIHLKCIKGFLEENEYYTLRFMALQNAEANLHVLAEYLCEKRELNE